MAGKKPAMRELSVDYHGVQGWRGGAARYQSLLLDNPDSVLLTRGPNLKIYDELLRDDQVHSTYQQRRTALTSASWDVEPGADDAGSKAAADFLREQLQHIHWDDKNDKMHYGIFYGYSVAECIWANDGARITLDHLKVRNRDRFKYNINNELLLMDDLQHAQGLKMPNNKFWEFCAGASHDDNPYGQGLAHSIYWPVFFKRNDIKFWLVFLEKFGMPTSAIRVPDGMIDDDKTISNARSVLEAIQTDSGVVVPDSMVVDLIEAARSGTADYNAMRDAMDKAISKVVLSQTMTTDDGSSLSQAQVHGDVMKSVTDSDSDLLNDSFMAGPGAWLTRWNFGDSVALPKIVRDTEPAEDLDSRAERDTKIYNIGFKPTIEYIKDTYGDGWEAREAAPVEPRTLTSGAGPLPPEFAEITTLLRDRADGRSDQEAIAQAAEYLSTQYGDVYGQRLRRLLGYLEESKDTETFMTHIRTMMAEEPPRQAVEKIRNANIVARAMAVIRGQKD